MRLASFIAAAVLLQAADANRLQTGTFRYNTRMDGKDVGNSEITIRKQDGNFVFTNHVTGKFDQRWEAIATASFVPISASLSFVDHPAFTLKYQDGRVTGFRIKDSVRSNVDAQVFPDTVDQRIDWAAAMAESTNEFAFHVYDPGIGSSNVTGRVAGQETVHVPAGTFDAVRIVYKIEKASSTEVYQVLTQRTGPRALLKEEFPNGAVTELLRTPR